MVGKRQYGMGTQAHDAMGVSLLAVLQDQAERPAMEVVLSLSWNAALKILPSRICIIPRMG